MKINFEFKPKEWIYILLAVVIVWLMVNGQHEQVVELIKYFYHK